MRLQDRHVIGASAAVGWAAIWRLGTALPVTSDFGYVLRVSGAIGLAGAVCMFGLAELALWMRRSEEARNERAFPIQPIDIAKHRRMELREQLMARDARKDGAA